MTFQELIDRAIFKVESYLGRKVQPLERMHIEFAVLTHRAISEIIQEAQQLEQTQQTQQKGE